MRKLIKILLSLVVIIIGALIIVPFLIPLDTYKQEAEKRLSQMTGRDIKVAGDVRLKLFPDISIALNDVTVGNPKGFSTPHLAKIDTLDVEVELKPLFDRQVVVHRLMLVKPDINLEINTSGAPNWRVDFNPPKMPTAARFQLISEVHAAVDAPKHFTINSVNLSGFSVEGGKVYYRDAASKTQQKLEKIDIKADTIAAGKPLDVDGSFKWNDLDFNIAAKAESLSSLLDQKPTKTSVKLSSEHIKVNFNGTLLPDMMSGNVELNTPSLVKMMAWLGKPVNWDKTPLQLVVSGDMQCRKSHCSLRNSRTAIDHVRLTGDLDIDMDGKPSVSGNLSTSVLDLKPFMSRAAKVSSNHLLIADSYAASDGHWSTDPIQLSGLSAFNADLELSISDLIMPPWELKDNQMHVTVKQGRGTLNIKQAHMLGGSVAGVVSTTPQSNLVNAACDLKASNIDIKSLLKILKGDDRLRGRGNVAVKINAAGSNLAEMVNSMDGSGNVNLHDGAIKGINLAQMARNVESAFTTQERGVQETDFSELSGSFAMTNGVISNDDLAMKSPYIRLSGEGVINLPAYTINYRLVPKLVDTGKGQGGAEDKAGIEVPILVTGSLDNPKFAPDLQSIVTDVLQNPEKIKENIGAIKDQIKTNKTEIKQEIKNLKESVKNPEGLLKDPSQLNNLGGLLFGKKPKAPADSGTVTQPETTTPAAAPAAETPATQAAPVPAPAETAPPTSTESAPQAEP